MHCFYWEKHIDIAHCKLMYHDIWTAILFEGIFKAMSMRRIFREPFKLCQCLRFDLGSVRAQSRSKFKIPCTELNNLQWCWVWCCSTSVHFSFTFIKLSKTIWRLIELTCILKIIFPDKQIVDAVHCLSIIKRSYSQNV